jgi:acetate kinase
MTDSEAILSLNVGSSSLKFALFDRSSLARAIIRGEISDLQTAPLFTAQDASGRAISPPSLVAAAHPTTIREVVGVLLQFIDARLGTSRLVAVGHRIVHGGSKHVAPALITQSLQHSLQALISLDPLHLPSNLAPISVISSQRPHLAQVACFDTAFHQTMPSVAAHFALPFDLMEQGVRRYGFHGLSYEYIASRIRAEDPSVAQGRLIVAHLGAGASLCALNNGQSIDTTTGFSSLDGLVMATRCGRLDPGVLLYLSRQGLNASEIEDLLYRRSGLLGVSGISGDIRVLLASNSPRAKDAIDLFVYRITSEAASMAAALGGLDAIIFTAGIGEHSSAIRSAVCSRLRWLGVTLDVAANELGATSINDQTSSVKLFVIATDEEAIIARHTHEILQLGA